MYFQKRGKKVLLLLVVVVLQSWLLYAADPPTPHSISGTIFHSDESTQVPTGTTYAINDTNSTFYLTSATSFPVPSFSGIYFETIQGSDGDYILVYAWNATHFGETNVTLQGNMNNIDVILNRTRPSEMNVTIINGTNNTLYDVGINFSYNVTIQNIGSQSGTNCQSVVTISDSLVFDVPTGESATHNLGTIAVGDTVESHFNFTGLATGNASIVINAFCDSDGVNLEQQNQDALSNISIGDQNGPELTLIDPQNNTINTTDPTESFVYQVEDSAGIANCSLYLNGVLNQSNTSTIPLGIDANFTTTFENGNYDWYIECFDNSGNPTTSETRNLTIAIYPPGVDQIFIEDPILLEEGIDHFVSCNVTASDPGGAFDIIKVNATLYHQGNSTPGGLDDNNVHYTNHSCENVSTLGNSKSFVCGFGVAYYANAGNWSCNATVMDVSNTTNSSSINTSVSELYALTTDTILSFGTLAPGATSASDSNVSIQNFGNMPINVSLRGYGANEGDGNAMTCLSSNISLSSQRYSVFTGIAIGDMKNTTNQSFPIENFTLPQRLNDTAFGNDLNYTFWKVTVPNATRGSCNGTLVFSLQVV